MGIAMPDSLQDWRITKLKEMGGNAYRTSHNPPTKELLDACDRQGMLVMDEARHLGDTYRTKTPRGTPTSDLSDLKEMVLRDRNHPSIIMWSMCNEEPLQGTPDGARIFSAMKAGHARPRPDAPHHERHERRLGAGHHARGRPDGLQLPSLRLRQLPQELSQYPDVRQRNGQRGLDAGRVRQRRGQGLRERV